MMIMTILVATPRCDLLEPVFGRVCPNTQHKYTNTQIQIRSKRHFHVVHFCPIESESQIGPQSVISIDGAEGIDEKMSLC